MDQQVTVSRELLRQVIDAMTDHGPDWIASERAALTALRAALEQPAPVQMSEDDEEFCCSAAASAGNKRGVRSTDALAIVAAYLHAHTERKKAPQAPHPAPVQEPLCKWPTCQTEKYQQDLADQIAKELVGEPRKAVKLSGEEVGMLTVFDGLHHVEVPLLAEFIRAIEQAVWAKLGVTE